MSLDVANPVLDLRVAVEGLSTTELLRDTPRVGFLAQVVNQRIEVLAEVVAAPVGDASGILPGVELEAEVR